MASRNDETRVTQDAADSAGVEGGPADEQSVKGAKLAHEDKALRGGRADGAILTSEPKRSADKTSASGGEAYPEDPPVRTTRPDVPIAVSMATGAGQHVPPDPEEYRPDGRVRDIADA